MSIFEKDNIVSDNNSYTNTSYYTDIYVPNKKTERIIKSALINAEFSTKKSLTIIFPEPCAKKDELNKIKMHYSFIKYNIKVNTQRIALDIHGKYIEEAQTRLFRSQEEQESSEEQNNPINKEPKKFYFGQQFEDRKARLNEIIEKVVVPQLNAGTTFKLDLNDKLLKEKCGLTSAQSKNARLELRRLDIIHMPEYSRTRGPGQYPIYILDRKYQIWTEKEKKKPRNKSYHELYYKFYELSKIIVKKQLAYMNIREIGVVDYMKFVWDVLRQLFNKFDIDRATLKLRHIAKNPQAENDADMFSAYFDQIDVFDLNIIA